MLKTYLQPILWAPLSFLERECSYLAEWLPMVCCLFDLIFYVPINIFQSSHVRTDLTRWTGTEQDLILLSVMSVYCSLVVTCCAFVTFPYRVLDQVRYLIVSVTDLLPYLTQGHNAVPPLRLESATPLSKLKHYTTGYCTPIWWGDFNVSLRLLLWPWNHRSRSNISYKYWHEHIHFW